jgi:O-acetyl-ADP-ribose deacetylase (regulator of RNase III)
MIELRRGNILDADAEALVNAVNCVGVMGKGLALQFKRALPDVFKAYERACRAGGAIVLAELESLAEPHVKERVPDGVGTSDERQHRFESYAHRGERESRPIFLGASSR